MTTVTAHQYDDSQRLVPGSMAFSHEVAQTPNPAKPVLNPNTVQALRDLAEPGEPDVFEEFATLFLTDAPERLREIEEAGKSREPSRLRTAAHTLKGSCSNMGAEQLASLCLEIEALAKAGDWAKLETLKPRLFAEYQTVVAALKDLAPSA